MLFFFVGGGVYLYHHSLKNYLIFLVKMLYFFCNSRKLNLWKRRLCLNLRILCLLFSSEVLFPVCRKRWHLFPPEDTAKLYPTRVPYEESSVFSQVDVLHPDLRRFPAFQSARAHVVTLQPGQVLYVPRHWWHYVESVDPLTVSINSWIELEMDDVARVSEAVAKTVVFAIKSAQSDDNTDNWLSPTEEEKASHDENMQYVNLAVRACAQRQQTQSPRDTCRVKRDSSGQIKKNRACVWNRAPFSVPFGPHLISVCCQQEELSLTQKHLDVKHSSEDYKEFKHTTITTNDLLGCLVHPDIITRVTELLLERHMGNHRNTVPL
uniref:Hspb associated protein 1 n=1 Tax=Acanthochromis polyacanthus TaxID=80966 RepID=A0A3Q1F2Z9_9TELE